jgi:dimethylamine/trimethylamine dehydrogenase
MVSLIRKGVLDMIGAARPSIADPYLPKKIEEGRLDDIRECIGCNICVSGDYTITPIRCTQNPTMGEEWRKGWHPEIMPAKASSDRVLIVGAGPAGLEAARALGLRGYEVALAEASTELGGRVNAESRLPGLAAWGRVRDYRLGQIAKMSNVETFPGSRMTAENILEQGFERVVLATGCHWRKDGVGRSHPFAIPGLAEANVFSPDDVMAGNLPAQGPVLVYDDDMFYLAGVLAERLVKAGLGVVYVTPGDTASSWTTNTLEVLFINKRLRALGVKVITAHDIVGVKDGVVELASGYGEPSQHIAVSAILPVTARLPEDALYHELTGNAAALQEAGIKSVTRIGDCLAPGLIAYAVYAGHRYARELDTNDVGEVKFRRPLPLMTTG